MTVNASEAFNSALTLFCSLYEDMNPADLPEGLSPDNQDVWFYPGSVQTRPALNTVLSSGALNTIMSAEDVKLLSGQIQNLFIDSDGAIFCKDVYSGGEVIVARVSPGVQFKAENAFGKAWFAFFSQTLAAAFSESPFTGIDVPRYYDGTNVWRVTQDAPGAAIAVVDSGTPGTTTAGVHEGVVMFKSFNGAITAPSVPFTFTSVGTLKWNASNIPIGPPGTAQRILAFTAAAGSKFCYITPTSASGVTTIIDDNTSTTATIDFTDVQLLAGTPIDNPGNDLFNQIVLAPCLGVIEYESRMFWYGEINNIKNLLNMGFDGGYLVRAACPLGWTQTYSTGGALEVIDNSSQALGFSLQMAPAAGIRDCEINQPAFQDFYGAPILAQNGRYYFRCLAKATGPLGGTLVCDVYSPGSGGVLSTVSIQINTLIGSERWNTGLMSAALPASIPADTVIRVYLNGVPNGTIVTIDELEIINAAQPVLSQQVRASYINNPFGYDEITGIIGVDSTSALCGAFKQRGYLYFLTTEELHQTQNNGSTEPNGWTVTEVAAACGGSGPCSVDSAEGIAFWLGKYGHRVFSGSTPIKISQEIQPTWDTINWNAQLSMWLVNDAVNRIVYMGLVTGEFSAPNIVYPVSYRSVNASYEVPDPLHISYSGKMICSDLSRKSTRWNVTANCGAMLTTSLSDGQQMVFGGGNGHSPGVGVGYGNLYILNPAKFTDDDFGVIPSYYTTYAHWSHDAEQQIPLLGTHRKLYTYLSAYVTGIGNIQVTPLVDRLGNAWNPTLQYELSQALDHDLEWGLNVPGDRVFFKVSVTPLPGTTDASFNMQHLVVAGRMDKVFPVRGAVL
jgi:hypothetical protein